MKLLFKQRIFSWFDSYDIYNEQGEKVYTVKGELAWGHCLKIMDRYGQNIGTVKEKVLTFLPKFELYAGEQYLGCVQKEFTFLSLNLSLILMAGAYRETYGNGTMKYRIRPEEQ